MHPNCVAALNAARGAAGGQPLTAGQIKAIDDRLGATMRNLARQDPAVWRATPADQRMLQAAQQAMADIKAEAQRALLNAQRQALKTAEVEQRVQDAKALGPGRTRGKALERELEHTAHYIEGIKRDSTRGLVDLIEAAGSTQGAGMGRRVLMALFDADNPAMTRDLALEVFAKGQAGTGNTVAKAGAKAWLEVVEGLRQRFNAAGGDVGQLLYGYLPQPHDQARVLAKGRDAWAQHVLPLLDRMQYVKEDGALMNDAELLDVLRGAWDTISSGGANKQTPGQWKGSGARANRGSDHRAIHFKDGAAYLGYLRDYGTGSMYDAMVGHIGGLARDIGLVERYGPNPTAQMRLQFDLVERADGKARGFHREIGNMMSGPAAQWSVVSGEAGSMAAGGATVGRMMQNARNIETFGKLQGALLSSITDLGTHFLTVGYNKLPYWQALADIGRAMAPGTRSFLNTHGMIAESMISDLNRWAGESIANNWSGRLANATMRLSLMNAWTDTLRRAFSLSMMRGLGKLAGSKAWDDLTPYDRWRMESQGVTAGDWMLMRRGMAQTPYGPMVTPEAVYATGDPRAGEVVAKLIGMVTDESERAVINPDLMTRAITSGGGAQRGTLSGELARAVWQFKSFPVAMISRHWGRMLETPQGLEGAPIAANRAVYGAALMVTLTGLGAIAFQTKQLVQGKDPVPMDSPKFWSRAVAQGGGLGFVGDILLADTTDDRAPLESFSRATLGPLFGSAADLYELTKGNADEALAGKKTHAAAEGFRFARSHAPLVNLWYARRAFDAAGLHALQETMSPGYLARIKNLHRKQWGGGYWWEPGDPLPERAPDFEAAAGR